MWENSEFKVEFSKCDMKEFERVMLSSGQCSFLCEAKMERQSVTTAVDFRR